MQKSSVQVHQGAKIFYRSINKTLKVDHKYFKELVEGPQSKSEKNRNNQWKIRLWIIYPLQKRKWFSSSNKS